MLGINNVIVQIQLL